jgi:hypothetical protein
MSSYGYRSRRDPPPRFVPADTPPNRIGAPTSSEARGSQKLPGSGHIMDASAGVIRSEEEDFRINLDEALLEVTDRQATPVVRVRLGRLGDNPEDYGIEVSLPDGSPLFAAGGLAPGSVGATHLAADSVEAQHLSAINMQVGKFLASANYDPGVAGWVITGDGDAEFNTVTIRGTLDGAGGTFAGTLQAAGGIFNGTLQGVDGTFSGTLQAAGGTFSTITAGLLNGANIVLNLNATGSTAVLEGTDFVIRANGSMVLGNHMAIDTSGNATFSGTLSAVGGTFGTITAGLLRSSNNRFRVNLNDEVLEVVDGDSTTRVRVGRLGAGTTNYGIEVRNSSGTLILGANGLGTNVVGSAQIAPGAVDIEHLPDTVANVTVSGSAPTGTPDRAGDLHFVV